jgi:uncharacterized protein
MDHTKSINFEELRLAAERGDPQAQSQLGWHYHSGEHKDFAEALRWYHQAADQGEPSAFNRIGVCYANGEGVARNFEEAVKWYRQAAEKGDVKAQNNLGACYAEGSGVPQGRIGSGERSRSGQKMA